MKKLKQILFPTDFSEPAKGAFLYALHIAKEIGANIKVLHVYRGDFGVPVPEVMAYQMLEARKEDAENNIIDFLKIATDAGLSDVPTAVTTKMGLASDEIVSYSSDETENIDLIMMGTKGEHNVADFLLGSVTTGVIANAKCPVLVIPEGAAYRDIQNIAYATDFKSELAESMKAVVEIANLFQATLHCVRVDTKDPKNNNDLIEFNKLLETLPAKDIQATEIVSDSIVHGLDQYVHEQGIQLLIMSRPKHSFIESFFHRSVTRQVVLQAPIPLMIIRR